MKHAVVSSCLMLAACFDLVGQNTGPPQLPAVQFAF